MPSANLGTFVIIDIREDIMERMNAVCQLRGSEDESIRPKQTTHFQLDLTSTSCQRIFLAKPLDAVTMHLIKLQ